MSNYRLFLITITVFAITIALLANNKLEEPDVQASALHGLNAVDLAQFGPWSVDSNSIEKPFGQPALSGELRAIAENKLKEAGIQSISRASLGELPQLKLLITYASESTLRGRRPLESVKLVIEDQVQLKRQPETTLRLHTWVSRTDVPVDTSQEESLKKFVSIAMDEFIAEYRRTKVAGRQGQEILKVTTDISEQSLLKQ